MGTVNLLLPTVNAATTAEANYALSGVTGQGALEASCAVHLQAVDPNAGAVAFPAALGISHAYIKSTDGKLYIRFINPTAGNYTAADTCTFFVMGL